MDSISIQRPIRQLRKQLKDFPRDPEPHQIHRLRTRIRQVQVTASIAPQFSRKWGKSLAAVRKAAGRIRDLDVLSQITQTLSPEPGSGSIERLQRRIRKDHKQASRSLEKALRGQSRQARKQLDEFARQLQSASASPTVEEQAGPLAIVAHRQIAQLQEQIAQWPQPDEVNLHDLRKNIKTLRTLLQLMPDSNPAEIKSLGSVASRIGQWHDWQRLVALANKCLDDSRDSLLLGQIARKADLHLDRAIEAAHSLRVQHPRPVKPVPASAESENQHRVA